MRRSPAEYYIRYRLLRDRDLPVEQVMSELADELVFAPGGQYAARLRQQMTPPEDFRPHDLGHEPSQRFLRRHKVRSLFHPHRGTREAIALFDDVRARTAVQTLIVAGADAERIVGTVNEHFGIVLSAAGLAEYWHYYWDVGRLTKVELIEYAKELLSDDDLARIAAAPPGPATVIRACATLGLPLPEVDEAETVRSLLAVTSGLGPLYATSLPPGPAQAQALKANAETVLVLREMVAEIRRDDDPYELRHYDVQTREFPMPSLADLAEGRAVPFPVGLLMPRDDAETAPGTDPDGDSEPARG